MPYHDTPRLENLEKIQKQSKPVHKEDQQAQSLSIQPSCNVNQRGRAEGAESSSSSRVKHPPLSSTLKRNEEGKKKAR